MCKRRRVGAQFAAAAWAATLSSAALAATPLECDRTSGEAVFQQAVASARQDCEPYRMRSWVRRKIVRESDLACYGLKLPLDTERADSAEPLVILVHGFNSVPERNAAILTPIDAAGITCGTFQYPNDYQIGSSAELLSQELRQLHRVCPDRRVVLICHSMGGLVARACLENPGLDPGNVDRLIMIAPPSHGTLVAHFAVGTDLWEHWLSRRSGGPWRRLRDSIVDGLGEAADELCPNSEFLQTLNGRQRNPFVRYTVILGTGALVSESQLNWIRESARDCLAKLPGADEKAGQLDAILNDVDELVDGRGDGVVAVKRGRLTGVSDTLIFPFGHLAVTGEPSDDVHRGVQAAVLERVQ